MFVKPFPITDANDEKGRSLETLLRHTYDLNQFKHNSDTIRLGYDLLLHMHERGYELDFLQRVRRDFLDWVGLDWRKDSTFIQLWLIYAQTYLQHSDSVLREKGKDILARMFHCGIGRTESSLYRGWASHYIQKRKLQKARKILQQGIRYQAITSEELSSLLATAKDLEEVLSSSSEDSNTNSSIESFVQTDRHSFHPSIFEPPQRILVQDKEDDIIKDHKKDDENMDEPLPPNKVTDMPNEHIHVKISEKTLERMPDKTTEKAPALAPPPPPAPAPERTNEKVYETTNERFTSSKNVSTGHTKKLVINGKTYIILGEIGRGGSSVVFKVISQDTQVWALKWIVQKNDMHDNSSYRNEIDLLSKLRGKEYIINMHDCYMDELNSRIFMLMEYGEIDLAQILKKNSDGCLKDEAMIRAYFFQMLKGVECIHKERIIHGDLKPANFLLVKGILKLIDFGIAKRMEIEATSILRDTQIGTLNYMSPEAILEHKEGNSHEYKLSKSADIWSLGCILHQMCFGFTPFSRLSSPVAKICAIIGPEQKIAIHKYPHPSLVDSIIEQSLNRDPKQRPTLEDLLRHPFITLSSYTLQVNHISQFFETAKISTPPNSNILFQEFCRRVNTGSQDFDFSCFVCNKSE